MQPFTAQALLANGCVHPFRMVVGAVTATHISKGHAKIRMLLIHAGFPSSTGWPSSIADK